LMRDLTCHLKDYIQPFERLLAIEELKALTAGAPIPIDAEIDSALQFRVRTKVTAASLRSRLAYWHSVGGETQTITSQLRSEATSVIARNGVALDDLPKVVPQIVDSKIPNRRCLRYATHGLHEYRGKFFPQLVRALINMASVPVDGIILDPMCGSGTTLVETVLSGRSAFGLDINPLSVFVADVKCQALNIPPRSLIVAFNALCERLDKPVGKLGRSSHFNTLAETDCEYLQKWFALPILEELDHIHRCIHELKPSAVRRFFSLCLSNILRDVSWQKSDDLRVRKEIHSLGSGEVVSRFIAEARNSAKTVVAFTSQRGRDGLGTYKVQEADARVAARTLPVLRGKVDAIITSPPYATALPYLDTDRLSLIYLGLLPRGEHRARDSVMIGNREVTENTRKRYWETFTKNSAQLPQDTQTLISKIDDLNKSADVGFRRRNLSALLAKYFFDMSEVIKQQLDLLRAGGVMFMVVGNNQTTAGGEEIKIQTTHHLAQIAESAGFRRAGNISMEMLTSRDIFRKNAMPSEQIIMLQKGQ
jgi:DNA modification methylase